MSTPTRNYLASQTVTIPALQSRPVPMTGAMFFCTQATDPFRMSIDGVQDFDMDQGGSFSNLNGEEWRTLVFHNPNAADLTITFYVGSSSMSFVPVINVVRNAPTYTKGSDVTNLAGGAQPITLSGSDGGKARKQVIITNLDAAVDLQILDGNNKVMGIAMPRQPITFETSGVVKIQNLQGNPAVQFVVGETFYA